MTIQAPSGDQNALPHADRRAFERVPLSIFGRCMLSNKLEIPCQTIDVSAGGMAAISAHTPTIGENVVVYLDNIGRIEGPIVRLFEGGFAMSFDLSYRAREKMIGKIAWCRENALFGKDNLREQDRAAPRQPISEMRMEDGRTYTIEIIDISLSGAAIRSPVRPAFGTRVTLGGMHAQIVRHFDDGIALEFVQIQDDKIVNSRYI